MSTLDEQQLYRAIDQNDLASFKRRCALVPWNECLLSVVTNLVHHADRQDMIEALFETVSPNHTAWAFHMRDLLEQAAKRNNPLMLEKLLSLPCVTPKKRCDAFVIACEHGSLECIKLLHTPNGKEMQQFSPSDPLSEYYTTGLHKSACFNRAQCVQYLLPDFVKSDKFTTQSLWEMAFSMVMSSISLNAKSEGTAILDVLLTHARPHAESQSAARACVLGNHVDWLKKIMDHCGDWANPMGCLHLSISENKEQSSQYLMTCVNLDDDQGELLAAAIQSGHTNMVDLFWDPDKYSSALDMVGFDNPPAHTLIHAKALSDHHALSKKLDNTPYSSSKPSRM